MAKKPMKFKRYEEGGDVEESKAKQRGLEMSNKEGSVGFFERLRMGNIDDPSSEAYKRFGAGRGRSEQSAASKPVSVDESMPVARPSMKPNPIFAAGEEQGKRQPSGDASVAEDYSGPRTKPIVTSVSKPTASAPTPSKPVASKPKETDETPRYEGPMRGQRSDAGTSPPVGNARRNYDESASDKMNIAKMRDDAKAALNEDPSALMMGGAGTAAALLARSKLGKFGKLFKGAKGSDAKRLEQPRTVPGKDFLIRDYEGAAKATPKGSPKKQLGYSKDNDVTDVVAKKRGGSVKKYASGGTVSSASKRADGIASKGKTRCKIC
jgi:hypothetical protein